jgi:hypothetical protein
MTKEQPQQRPGQLEEAVELLPGTRGAGAAVPARVARLLRRWIHALLPYFVVNIGIPLSNR